MRSKYIEERFPRYFEFGEHEDGRVDLATINESTIATVTRKEATKIITDRLAMLDMLCKVALKLAALNPEEFNEIWYGK